MVNVAKCCAAAFFVLASQLFLPPSSLWAAEVSLKSGGKAVPLSATQAADLPDRLDKYFQTCHSYDRVVPGKALSQQALTKLWKDQEHIVHAVLRVTYGSEILFAFPIENDGLGPVLRRDSSKQLSSYIKCPGLDGLLLACYVHGLVPGVKPNQRCPEWRDLKARQPATAADLPSTECERLHPEARVVDRETTAPKALARSEPDYSNATAAGFRCGDFLPLLQAIVDEEGRVVCARLITPQGKKVAPAVAKAFEDGVMRWRFTPAMRGGRAIAVKMYFTINFRCA
jgi:hypothetical protein